MLNPSPVPLPWALVVKNGSKILPSTCGGMPLPVSLTAICTPVRRCARAHRDATAWLAGVEGVRHQAEQHLIDSRGIAGDQGQGGKSGLQHDLKFGGPAAGEIERRGDSRVQVCFLEFLFVQPGKVAQAGHDALDAFGSLGGAFDEPIEVLECVGKVDLLSILLDGL